MPLPNAIYEYSGRDWTIDNVMRQLKASAALGKCWDGFRTQHCQKSARHFVSQTVRIAAQVQRDVHGPRLVAQSVHEGILRLQRFLERVDLMLQVGDVLS